MERGFSDFPYSNYTSTNDDDDDDVVVVVMMKVVNYK